MLFRSVCSVGVVTALLFYHCEPDSPLRDNGAIAGAAAGFAEEDEVIVQVKTDKSEARVIAHVDGVRSCGWKIKIFRDDDIVNPINAPASDFYLQMWDDHWNIIINIDPVYDPESYYKRNADGSRKKDSEGNDIPVFNPVTKCWEFDSYIRDKGAPTHPVIPPRGSAPAKFWNGSAYEDAVAPNGYVIATWCRSGSKIYYRNLTEEQKESKKWPRFLSYNAWDAAPVSEKRVMPSGTLILAIPYLEEGIYKDWDNVHYTTGTSGMAVFTPAQDTDSFIYRVTCSVGYTITYAAAGDEESVRCFHDVKKPTGGGYTWWYCLPLTVWPPNHTIGGIASVIQFGPSFTRGAKISFDVGEITVEDSAYYFTGDQYVLGSLCKADDFTITLTDVSHREPIPVQFWRQWWDVWIEGDVIDTAFTDSSLSFTWMRISSPVLDGSYEYCAWYPGQGPPQ